MLAGLVVIICCKKCVGGVQSHKKVKEKDPYGAALKPLHLCWKLESEMAELGFDPPGGYSEYSPRFMLTKLQHCL